MNIKNKFGNQSWGKKKRKTGFDDFHEIFAYLYEVNHSKNHPRKNYENKSRKDANFNDFKQNDCM